ncbi:hypothetical protein BCR37DRAFT_119937 [Protomyces lactucae-debilis]|uniref:Uncharacterized protein n=1 Tax=Protomyces lactucae-debilis TaxID=2754530 RepID=A0A1Y2F1H3_PROLT|nr:uncharacterized protein BCR37DRAFT_119937 [Protomyces lactucae-debilis]ORY77718.1 hypothetical protein BCR37DRAFT_119937 [Protomyces lactucae-debilis]
MSAIIIAIVVLVVAAVIGFVAFVVLYHLKQRRNGMPTSGILPPVDAFKSAFTGRGTGSRGNHSAGGAGIGGAFGLGRMGGNSGEERSTRFAALDVDEAWDTHVDEEMGYDQSRSKDQRLQSGRGMSGRLSHEELDDRYESVMDGGDDDERNPFGSGAYDAGDVSPTNDHRKSAFKEAGI